MAALENLDAMKIGPGAARVSVAFEFERGKLIAFSGSPMPTRQVLGTGSRVALESDAVAGK